MFSRRTNWDLGSNPLALALAQRKGLGLTTIDLTESNPTRVGLTYPGQEILEAISSQSALVYEPSALGHVAAREAIARYYCEQDISVNPGQIVVTASSSESYSMLLKLLCDPGDSIVIPQPSYPLFDDLTRLECVRTQNYGLLYDGIWHIDVASIRQAVDCTTRGIFVVSPNNPTGSCLRPTELEVLDEIAQQSSLAIVSDEVFIDYRWNTPAPVVRCVATESEALSFSLGGLSKAVCLPQLKLGWIVVGGPSDLRETAIARLEMIADTFLSVGTPVQHAAARLLQCRLPIQELLRERIARNMSSLTGAIPTHSPITLLHTEAGWYSVLRVPSTMTDEQWAEGFMMEDGVSVHPGSWFGFEGQGFIVVSLIGDETSFQEGIRRIVARVQAACA